MDLKEINERMHGCKLYVSAHESLMAEQAQRLDMLYTYNHTRPSEQVTRQKLLEEMFAEIGKDCYIEPPFFSNWGGKHVHFGDNVYGNFNLTLVDDTHIYVGDNVMFGPNVTICTATHPIHPELRLKLLEYNVPIHIGKSVWIGANSTVLPGVSIGENSVIGAGSVVVKDIPANVIAFGNPCKVYRPISERDLAYYYKDMKVDM